MKKNTKKFITNIVALSMAFTSVVSTSSFVSANGELTAEAAETEETVSGSSVLVDAEDEAVDTDADEKSTLFATSDLTAVGYGGVIKKVGGATFKATQTTNSSSLIKDGEEAIDVDGWGSYTSSIVTTSKNNAKYGGKTARALGVITAKSTTEISLLCKVDSGKTVYVLQSDNDAGLADSSDSPYDFSKDESVTPVLTISGAGNIESYSFTAEPGKYYYVLGQSTNFRFIDIQGTALTTVWDFTDEEEPVLSKAIEKKTGKITANDIDVLVDATKGKIVSEEIEVTGAEGEESTKKTVATVSQGTTLYVPVSIGDKVSVTTTDASGSYKLGGTAAEKSTLNSVIATLNTSVLGSELSSSLGATKTQRYIPIEVTAETQIELIELKTGEVDSTERVVGSGKFLPTESKVTKTFSQGEVDQGQTFEVEFDYSGDEINNMTGFLTYNADVIELVDAKITGTASSSYSFGTSTKPTTDMEGYESYEQLSKTVPDPETAAEAYAAYPTEAQLGKVKFTFIEGIKDVTSGDAANTNSVKLVATFKVKSYGSTDVTIAQHGNFRNANGEIVTTDIESMNVSVGTYDYQGKITASSPVIVKKVGREVEVKFTYEGEAVNTVTGFIQYDPTVAILKSGELTVNGESVEGGSLATALETRPGNDIEGYDYLDYKTSDIPEKLTDKTKKTYLTEAELGKVKVVKKFDEDYATSTDKYELTLTFETVDTEDQLKDIEEGGISTTVSFLPYGQVKTADNEVISVDYTNAETSITVDPNATIAGKYGMKILTTSDNGYDGTESEGTLKEGFSTFEVALVAEEGFSVNALTAYLDFDSSVVQPVAVLTTSPILSTEVVEDAMNYVPSSTNKDFANYSADGETPAYALGRLKLANVIETEGTVSDFEVNANDKLLVIQFARVGNGSSEIKFTNIETTNVALDQSVQADTTASVNISFEGTIDTTVLHLAGDVNHNGELDASDASATLNLAKSGEANDLDTLVGDVGHVDGTIDATDAAAILSGAKDADYKFVNKTDIKTVDGKQYIEIPTTLADSCDANAKG